MKKLNIPQDIITFSSLIDGYAKRGKLTNAIYMYNKMLSNSI
jgi:pentatricopeptide repeat protein